MVKLMHVINMCMSPVVKWAGGKCQILDKLKENLPVQEEHQGQFKEH